MKFRTVQILSGLSISIILFYLLLIILILPFGLIQSMNDSGSAFRILGLLGKILLVFSAIVVLIGAITHIFGIIFSLIRIYFPLKNQTYTEKTKMSLIFMIIFSSIAAGGFFAAIPLIVILISFEKDKIEID